MNISKQRDPRFWKRWYLSGAVAQQQFPSDVLTIEAIGVTFYGTAAGYQTLSLGNRIINSGPGWSVSEPICAVVVPVSKKYRPKTILSHIPRNAVPDSVFFPLAQAKS